MCPESAADALNGSDQNLNQESRKPRLLIADDESTFREATCELLQREGFVCDCVPDGPSAVEAAQTHEYDAIITDIKMPGNTELETLQKLRDSACDAALILVTGFPSLQTAVKSLNLRVAAYLVKPFEIEELLEVLRSTIPNIRGERRIRELAGRMRRWSREIETLGQSLRDTPSGQLPTSASAVFDLTFGSILEALVDLREVFSDLMEGKGSDASSKLFESRALASLTNAELGDQQAVQELSPREREVLIKLVEGNRVSNIARLLDISPHTVRNHLKSVFSKLGVSSQAELIEWFKAQRFG